MNNKTNLRLSRPARIALGYVAAAALWIFLSDGMVAALMPDEGTQLAVQSWKGTGFVLVTGLVLYALLRTQPAFSADPAPASARKDRFSAVLLGLTFLLLATLIVGFGTLAYRSQAAAFKAQQLRQQAAIAELKAGQIARWVEWRRHEAEQLGEDPDLAAAVRKIAAGASPANAEHVRRHFKAWLKSGRWTGIGLHAADGRPLLQAGNVGEPGAELRQSIAAAAAAATFRLHDIYATDAAGTALRIDFLMPIASGADGAATGAVVVLSTDPRTTLFPMAQSWPIPSATSEALLVRDAGNAAAYVTPPRHAEDKPLQYQDHLSDLVQTAASNPGQMPIHFEGMDYRGESVFATVQLVPGTPWHIMAKTDISEFMQPLQQQARQILAMVLLAVGVTGLFVAFLWRSRQAAFAVRERQGLAERDALARKFEALFQQARDSILLVAPDGRIAEANEAALAAYGYSAEEIRALRIRDLRAADALDALDNQFEAAEGPGGIQFETVHRRKDGSVFPVEVSSRVVEFDGQRFRQSIVRDISERRRAEATVRGQFDELRRWYAVTLDREGRVAELKAEVNALRARLGEPPRYASPAPPRPPSE